MENQRPEKSPDTREALARTRAALDRARTALEGTGDLRGAPAPPPAPRPPGAPRDKSFLFLPVLVIALLGIILAAGIIGYYRLRLQRMSREVTQMSALVAAAQEAQERETEVFAQDIARLQKEILDIKRKERKKFLGIF